MKFEETKYPYVQSILSWRIW